MNKSILLTGTEYVGISNGVLLAQLSDVIIANKFESILEDIKDKVYTHNILNSDS